VAEIYGTVGERNFVFVKKLAELSPDTRIYSNLSPTMMNYEPLKEVTAAIGADAMYYHSDIAGIPFNEEQQPFGYRAVELLFDKLDKALSEKEGSAK
jgi:nitrogenase molybdenum-cofactor synthesis protein NifE